MKLKFALLLLTLLTACSSPSRQECLDFLYASMPLADSLVHPLSYWEANVDKTLEVRKNMKWHIPEREWRHFVLPLRVNNEDLDDFRTVYADTLCKRVKGLSIADAALEINHWCHEQATYRPSDSRTLGPMAVIKSGLGRCGEESVLAVSALRAAGIPARQVYTPRWAHTDDNHAWVEVWADGKWHFMGACEPEPVLDLAWFNAPVSRAMLLHTRVYGKDYDGPEDVISRDGTTTEINVIKGYIPTHRTSVTVLDREGRAVEGAKVEFKIYNYAEFYTVASYLSDSTGCASLDTGVGDVVVWASKGENYGIGVVRGAGGTVVLDRKFGEDCSFDLDIVPPCENPLPDNSTEEQRAENAARLAAEDSIRSSHIHTRTAEPRLFLCEKDEIDISGEVIDDVLSTCSSTDRYVVSPRVEREMLYPYRKEILASGIASRLSSAAEAVQWVRDSIRIIPQSRTRGLCIPPFAVWRSRIADVKSRDIIFVAMCRTLGWRSRINIVTGAVQYGDEDKWVDVNFESGEKSVVPTGTFIPFYPDGQLVKTPKYYSHFTLSSLVDGSLKLCEFDEFEPLRPSYTLAEGYYMLCSGVRLADGSVKAHVEMFSLPSCGEVERPLVLRSSLDRPQVIGSMDPEQLFLADGATLQQSILSATGRGYFLLCVTGTNDEPSAHLKAELENSVELLNEWGRKLLILGGIRPSGINGTVFGEDVDGKVASMLRSGVESAEKKLPVVALCDSFGRIIFYSEGYDTSLASKLASLIPSLE